MDQIDQLRTAASSLLTKAQGGSVSDLASAVEKTTNVLRLSSDIEKSQAELRKLALEEEKLKFENSTASKRERSERLKEYVAVLAPIVTIVTLAATLIAQNWQFVRSEKDKNDAAMDAQWEETVKTLSQGNKLPPGIIALHPFLNDPKYADRARLTAVQLLSNSTDPAFFDDLFGAAFVPVGWQNLEDVLKINRALLAKGNPLFTKSWDEKAQTNKLDKLSNEEKNTYNYVNAVMPKLSAQIGSVLKTPRPTNFSLNLSASYFKDVDWSGIDLSGANLENTQMAYVNLKGANLSNINNFAGVSFYWVAWWEAKSISPAFREYLETNYKCDPKMKYGEYGDKTFTVEECTADIDRLRHQSQ